MDGMLDLRQSVHTLLTENSRSLDHLLYTVPSNTSYPYQWFWDSCFHAILWSHFDPKRAQAELDALVFHQHPNGFIGHVIYWQPSEILAIDWGIPHMSSLIQPPLLAYAIWRVYQVDQDKAWLKNIYPQAVKFYDYILAERDVRQVGLYGLVNPDESGEDNAPKFDAALGLPPQNDAKENTKRRYALFDVHRKCNYIARCTAQEFWVEDAAYNTYLVWNLDILSDMAYTLGEKKSAQRYQSAALTCKQAMRTHMFEAGRYQSLSGLTGDRVETDSWDQFLPLLAGLYSQSEAHTLINHSLKDPERFWTAYGIPTVSLQDPAFAPDEPTWGEAWQHPDWRGAIWMVPHWCLYHGLTRYGYHDEAAQIKDWSFARLEAEGFRENYHPHDGKGMGAERFTWGGLTLDMQPDIF